MGRVIWAAGLKVAAVNLEIDYRKPLPLHQPLKVTACILQKNKRKILSSGEIHLSDGTVAVRGRGVYVIAPQLFQKAGSSDEG